jgi:hypothetical protein
MTYVAVNDDLADASLVKFKKISPGLAYSPWSFSSDAALWE